MSITDLLQPQAVNIIRSWQRLRAELCTLHSKIWCFFFHLGMWIIFISVKPHYHKPTHFSFSHRMTNCGEGPGACVTKYFSAKGVTKYTLAAIIISVRPAHVQSLYVGNTLWIVTPVMEKLSSQGWVFHCLTSPDKGNRGVTSRNHTASCLRSAMKLRHPGGHHITGQ